jgi:hypothetical protein
MTPTKTQHFIQVRERNRIVFYVALAFPVTWIPRPDGGLDGEFELTTELERATLAFHQNGLIPVQNFISASRYVSDAIHSHRQLSGRLL